MISEERQRRVAAPQEPTDADKRIAEWKSSYDAKCVENTANFLRAEKAEVALARVRDKALLEAEHATFGQLYSYCNNEFERGHNSGIKFALEAIHALRTNSEK